MSAYELPVADRFPEGTKVEAHPRVADFFTPGQTKPAANAKVKDGIVSFSGLVPHGPYFAAAELTEEVPETGAPNGRREVTRWVSVAFTASNPAPAQNREETNAQAAREAEATAKVAKDTALDLATAPAGGDTGTPARGIHEGARGTEVLSTRIEGVKAGTPLESHTATGEAVVVEDDSDAPEKSASSARKGTSAKKRTAKKAAKKTAKKGSK